jgi:hypothetical protein
MFDQKILKGLLPYVLGKKKLTTEDLKTSEENLRHMRVLGLVTSSKGNHTVREDFKNMIVTNDSMWYDFKDEIPHFKKADFDCSVPNVQGYSIVKISGEDYASIIRDEDEKTVLYLKYIQDSRHPWISIEGDTRRHILSVVSLEKPTKSGVIFRMGSKGIEWTKSNRKTYLNGIPFESFLQVPEYIRTQILNLNTVEDRRKVEKVEFGPRKRRQFISGGCFMATISGENTFTGNPLTCEIQKNPGSIEGSILVDGVVVGTTYLSTTGILHVKVTDKTVNRVDVDTCCQIAATCPVSVPSEGGSKQFQV